MPITVAVTETEFRKAEGVFASNPRFACVPAPADESGLVRVIETSGARHAIVGAKPYEGALYGALGRGSVLARFGVGHDGIDKAKATAAGILCTNTPGVLDASVAEHAMLLIAAAARHLPLAVSPVGLERWSTPAGSELAGKTLAVIGCGRIGTALARIAAHGYGMRIIGFARSAAASADDVFSVTTTGFADAVRDAQYVSLHIGATPENVRFINEERLSHFGRDAWLVNTARGAVVDEEALFDSLESGTIAGAALDVFEHEPYVPVAADRDFRRLPNVILTPHIGSHTAEANRRMAQGALFNVELGEDGEFGRMALLNPEVLQGVSDVRE